MIWFFAVLVFLSPEYLTGGRACATVAEDAHPPDSGGGIKKAASRVLATRGCGKAVVMEQYTETLKKSRLPENPKRPLVVPLAERRASRPPAWLFAPTLAEEAIRRARPRFGFCGAARRRGSSRERVVRRVARRASSSRCARAPDDSGSSDPDPDQPDQLPARPVRDRRGAFDELNFRKSSPRPQERQRGLP